jgi:hypothetical protein
LNTQHFLAIKFVLGPSRDQEIAICSWYTGYVHLPAYMHERALLLRDKNKYQDGDIEEGTKEEISRLLEKPNQTAWKQALSATIFERAHLMNLFIHVVRSVIYCE